MPGSKFKINLAQLLLNLSRSLDFSSYGLTEHHKRVTLISLQLGKAAGLTGEELSDLFQAAVIHDAGAATWREKLRLEQFDIDNPWDHCFRGQQMLTGLRIIGSAAGIILSHHDRWQGNNPSGLRGEQIPLASRIIHLADRVDILIRPELHQLDLRKEVMAKIQAMAGSVFDPHLVELLLDLSKREIFWLDLTSPWLSTHLDLLLPAKEIHLEPEELIDIGILFGRVVDAKSRFTYRHSNGVARVAKLLGIQAGLGPDACVLLNLAGVLHDIGKLSVPEEIIEKPGKLSDSEFCWMKQHAYYTYWLLQTVAPQLLLAERAAYHHERLDGRGYPFQKSEAELDIFSRIITVADIFTALREERPYRGSLTWPEIRGIMTDQVTAGAIDAAVVEMLLDSRNELEALWLELSSQMTTGITPGDIHTRAAH